MLDENHRTAVIMSVALHRWFDIETGLYYYRARYYNPHIGQEDCHNNAFRM